MAHFRRPVPKIVWAAKPPGSLDLTYFLRSVVSSSAGAASVADTTSFGVLSFFGEMDIDLDLCNETKGMPGFWEIWEENEREEREDVRGDIAGDIAIVELG